MPGRSALTVTPCTAVTVPMALSAAATAPLRDDRGHGLGRRLEGRRLGDRRLDLLDFERAETATSPAIPTSIKIIRFVMRHAAFRPPLPLRAV